MSQWRGDFSSWSEALKCSQSYSSDEILERVVTATNEVEAGRAACERDGCNFAEIAYSWPLLSSLLWIYAQQKRLSVVDIGGSLGSTWRQNRKFLGGLASIEWMIVEQAEFVRTGRALFQAEPLTFHMSIAECWERSPNVALLSSSLQYIDTPWSILDELAGSDIGYLLIDRTPMSSGEQDRLTVQHVAPRIYSASYPCWVFSLAEFERRVGRHWNVLESWRNPDEHYKDFNLHGFLLVKRGAE